MHNNGTEAPTAGTATFVNNTEYGDKSIGLRGYPRLPVALRVFARPVDDIVDAGSKIGIAPGKIRGGPAVPPVPRKRCTAPMG